MNKVKNILVLQSRIEIMVSVTGLGHGVPVCGFHTRPTSENRFTLREGGNCQNCFTSYLKSGLL